MGIQFAVTSAKGGYPLRFILTVGVHLDNYFKYTSNNNNNNYKPEHRSFPRSMNEYVITLPVSLLGTRRNTLPDM